LRPGMSLLVHSAAGGVGSALVALGKIAQCRVVAVVGGARKVEHVRALGADLVIDVRHKDFVAVTREWTGGRGLDVVVDNLGGDVLARSLESVRTCGTVVTMGFVAGLEVKFHIRNFFFTHKRLLGTLMGDAADLQYGLDLVKAGRVRPLLDRALPLSEAAESHRLVADNKVLGSLVLVP